MILLLVLGCPKPIVPVWTQEIPEASIPEARVVGPRAAGACPVVDLRQGEPRTLDCDGYVIDEGITRYHEGLEEDLRHVVDGLERCQRWRAVDREVCTQRVQADGRLLEDAVRRARLVPYVGAGGYAAGVITTTAIVYGVSRALDGGNLLPAVGGARRLQEAPRAREVPRFAPTPVVGVTFRW